MNETTETSSHSERDIYNGIFEYMYQKEQQAKKKPVIIKGFCDDPYCPECNYGFWDYGDKNEVDCLKCPECGCMLDWGPWHRSNDND